MAWPMIIAAGVAAAAGITSAIIGGNQKASAEEKAAKEREIAAQLFANLDDPAVRDLIAPYLNESAMEHVATDPRLKEAQMTALQRLQEVGLNGGMTDEDRQMAATARNQASQYEQGQRNAISQSFQQRGAGGSGMELASQLQAQQGGANRMNAMSMDQAANAQRRALQAIQQSGELGGRIRGQEWDEKAQVARSKDTIAQFNAGLSQWQQDGNNRNAMNIADYRMRRAAGQSGQLGAIADSHVRRGENDAAMTAGIGQSVAQGAGAVGSAYSGVYQGSKATQPQQANLTPEELEQQRRKLGQ